jgi:hypothetical protein
MVRLRPNIPTVQHKVHSLQALANRAANNERAYLVTGLRYVYCLCTEVVHLRRSGLYLSYRNNSRQEGYSTVHIGAQA